MTYSHQAQKLGEQFHVISFDQYGVFRSEAIPEEQNADVKYHVDLIEQMRIALDIKSWIPLGHSFRGMLALVYAHSYPEHVDAVIYDCPMWSALYTARAIASSALPYFKEKNDEKQKALVSEILTEGISAKDAFQKAMSIVFDDDLNHYCHVIETSRYNSYINEYIEEPKVSDDCWRKYISLRQKLFESEDFYCDYLSYLADINKPQFLIVGEYDMTCGKFEQEWFAGHSPNGKIQILADSAHLSWFEQPEKYTELITDYVLSLQ